MTPIRRRMIDDMQVRNLAAHTQRAYLHQVSLFSRHFGKSPEAMGPEEIRAYQIHLAIDRQLSASSILVYRPAYPRAFNDTVVVCWNNVTAGYELFFGESPEVLAGGYAYVCASVQKVGVHGFDDDASYDILLPREFRARPTTART